MPPPRKRTSSRRAPANAPTTETVEVTDIPPERLDNVVELRKLDGWRVRTKTLQPDGRFTVVFER